MDAVTGAANAARILDDAAARAEALAGALPDLPRQLIERGGGTVTSGIPRFTWNGLDESGRLFPGVHPATAGELELRFAWNDQRARMFERMRSSLAELRSHHPEVRYVAGGGSYFSAKARPGDVDLVLLARRPDLAETRTRNARDHLIHVYPAKPTLAGVPQRSFVDFFRHDRDGAERGLVLFDLDDLLATR